MSEREWTDERSMNDAPIHYDAAEASAWACGWDAAVEAFKAQHNLPTQPQED